MYVLTFCPESAAHGRVFGPLDARRPAIAVTTKGRLTATSDPLSRESDLEVILLQVHKFRAGSRIFWIAAEHATAYTETEDIVDMLIDLDPVDVQRILAR